MMSDAKLQDFVPQYAAALAAYLANRNETAREAASELGELASCCGVLTHQLVSIHAQALASATSREAAAAPAHFEFLGRAIIALARRMNEASSVSLTCSHCRDSMSPRDAYSDASDTLLMDTRKRREFLTHLSARILRSSEPEHAISEVIRGLVPQLADCVTLHWIRTDGEMNLAERHAPEESRGTPPCGGQLCQELARMAVSQRRVLSVEEPESGHIRHAIVLPFVAEEQVLGALCMCQVSGAREVDFVHEFAEQMACCTQHAFESARYRAAAQSSHKFMDEYLNRAIHDLSSPLGTLSLVLEIGLNRIEEGGHPNESSLRRALAQVEQMTSVLKELLDTTRALLADWKSSSRPNMGETP